MKKKHIGLVGAGNMGLAILEGIYQDFQVSFTEKDRRRAQAVTRKCKIPAVTIDALMGNADIIILAVKPQVFSEVLREVKAHLKKRQLIVSIAAGITIRYIQKSLGSSTRIIRTMPNLPAKVKQGITAICANEHVTRADVAVVKDIFRSVGEAVVVEEKLIDSITALSGSGPAYVFYYMECMLKAAQALGLDAPLARQLAQQTFKGSLALMEASPEDPKVLRQKVTSKGGTTQAALEVFQKHHFDNVFIDALKAAKKRAKQLSR